MTVCVPQKPFIILGQLLCLLPLAYLASVPLLWWSGHELLAMFGIAQATCFPVLSYGVLRHWNDKYHWIQWCKVSSVKNGSEKR